jgi:hypothetical protein
MGRHLRSVLEPLLTELCDTVNASFREWPRSYQIPALGEQVIGSADTMSRAVPSWTGTRVGGVGLDAGRVDVGCLTRGGSAGPRR